MHPARTVGVVALMACVALMIVALRGEQARTASRIMKLSGERIALRRDLWAMQMAVARLRAPDQVRDRIERLAGDGAKDSGKAKESNRRVVSGIVPPHELDRGAMVR